MKVKESPIFVKHAKSGGETNLYSHCCFKHVYSEPKCHNLHNVLLFFFIYISKELYKQASEFSSNLEKWWLHGAKFNGQWQPFKVVNL